MKKILLLLCLIGFPVNAQLYQVPQKPMYECEQVVTNKKGYFYRCQSQYDVCVIYKESISCYKK